MLVPAERVAFVLHDLFAVPFDEIAPILGRSPAATRQLASRARRRAVDAFLAASRGGDFDALLAMLDPDVVLRADRSVVAPGAPREFHGALAVATQQLTHRAKFAQPALVNGSAGVVVAPRGRLLLVIDFTYQGGKITEIDVVADPARLRQLELAVLEADAQS
jgi:ketosteroid isomerase-like protein